MPTSRSETDRFHAALLECINMDFSDLDHALGQIVQADLGVIGVARVGVWLLDRDGRAIDCRMEYRQGGQAPGPSGARLNRADFPAYFRAVEEARVVAAEDALNDPRTRELEGYLRQGGVGAMLDVAIRGQGRTLGVLCHEHEGGPRAWSVREVEFAVSMADMVSLALEMEHRRAVEARLTRAAEQFLTLAQTASDAIVTLDGEGRVDFWNQGAERLFGRTAQAMQGRPLVEIMPERYRNDHKAGFEAFRDSGRLRHAGEVLELMALRADGAEIPVELTLAAWRVGEAAYVTGIVRDITERKAAERALQDANERLEARVLERTRELDHALRDLARAKMQLQLILDAAGEGILGIDAEGNVVLANPAACQMAGRSQEELLGQSPHRLLHHSRPDGAPNPPGDCRLLSTLRDGRRRASSEEVFWRADGTHFPVEYSVAPLLQDEAISGAVMLFKDITERKRHEEQLKHRAFHDALTGLPNRALLLERLRGCLGRASREQGHAVGLLYMDLDDFKLVNDSLGHGLGDELLVEFAARLSGELPGSALMARLGGDEFAVLLEGAAGEHEPLALGARLQACLREPLAVRDYRLYVSVCIGVVQDCRGYHAPEDVLRDADTAMYQAKASGKGERMLFDAPMHDQVRRRLNLETALRAAVESRAFELHYQPIFTVADMGFAGFEALIRWPDPETGRLIPPGHFIPVAERTGLIVPMGEWVLSQACRDLARWAGLFPGLDAFFVAVNLSGRQFMLPDLDKAIADLAAAAGVDTGRLKLEITESEVMQNPDVGIKTLTSLRDAGFRLFVDDFGTGYSSLSYLRRLPIAGLKVDRSFVAGMCEDQASHAIVRAVVDLARNLGLAVVAEGVETAGQLEALRGLSCDLGQGWLYAKALAPDAAQAYLEGQSRAI